MRYMIARWSFSTRIFAWELWSELDLTGSEREGPRNFKRPEVVDWHRDMARAIREMDPFDHMISTHVAGDFGRQNPDIISLPEMSLCPVDAYHSSPDPLNIILLLKNTVDFNNPYNKPVLITEFGGTSSAQGLIYLDNSLHAALWASACMPIGGTPLFWWWGLIEEEKMYPKYAALSKFLKDEDRRDPTMILNTPQIVVAGRTNVLFSSVTLNNKTNALGWIFFTGHSWQEALPLEATAKDLTVRLGNMNEGVFDVSFFDTTSGDCVKETPIKCEGGILNIQPPQFTRDIAFKVKLHPHAATRKAR
jgi:hypothetical protein